ncbi:hypothetical protein QNO07_22470 [Streptomyces sp. 549]|uniref:hypothetical protein n=1 Tax=Streptomyces sp. 549 TaxID=3049076 RepID=UPI0024C2E768|nr:hypothetical protein [Streptomyces sp. 549]MDK1476149.1 hypothetical protein [Streptomyces sp. 549]
MPLTQGGPVDARRLGRAPGVLGLDCEVGPGAGDGDRVTGQQSGLQGFVAQLRGTGMVAAVVRGPSGAGRHVGDSALQGAFDALTVEAVVQGAVEPVQEVGGDVRQGTAAEPVEVGVQQRDRAVDAVHVRPADTSALWCLVSAEGGGERRGDEGPALHGVPVLRGRWPGRCGRRCGLAWHEAHVLWGAVEDVLKGPKVAGPRPLHFAGDPAPHVPVGAVRRSAELVLGGAVDFVGELLVGVAELAEQPLQRGVPPLHHGRVPLCACPRP